MLQNDYDLQRNLLMRFIWIFFIFTLLNSALANSSESNEANFSLKIKGVYVGNLSFSGVQDQDRYTVEGTIKSGGVFKLLNKQEYTAKTTGQIKHSKFIPKNYAEYRNKKGKKSTASLSYELGIPQIRLYSPPRKTNSETINPETQKGTVDPLTAIYATLADISNGKLCELNMNVFDGKRKSSVRLIPILKERKGLIMCFGEYKRIAGFSKKDMEEKTRFPFNLFYKKHSKTKYELKKLIIETIYGTAVLTRKNNKN